MTIAVGDRIPEATLNTLKDGVQALDTHELFDGRKVLMFAVPGAFTPTCSAKHLPATWRRWRSSKSAASTWPACRSTTPS
jgi:peroxiredoxin